jgi:hypothetical protein
VDTKRHGARITPLTPATRPAKRVELPFKIRIVRTDKQLGQAVQIRSEAYSRHVPTLGQVLAAPENVDRDADAIVLLAEGKSDGIPLGTIRIQTNFASPLSIQASIELPEPFQDRPLAGVSRLGVKAGPRGRLVKLALFKAMHRYCLAKQVEWVLIGARTPLEQDYLNLGFTDVFEDHEPRALQSAKGIPHRILAFEVLTAERRWFASNHPLYVFMFKRFHPDIEIFASVNNMWSQPRARHSNDLSALLNFSLPVI